MKILIADDHPIFRAGLKEILSKEKEVKLIGEAETGRKALELARSQHWDVVLLDLTMPGKDGVEGLAGTATRTTQASRSRVERSS